MRLLRDEHLRLFWRNRRLVPRVLLGYGKVLLGHDVLRGVELAITYRCNASCAHCCVGTLRDDSRRELSPAEIARVVGELIGLGVLNVNLTGGEPLLRDDLFEILDRLRGRNVFLTMGTNGFLVDPGLARRLARSGLRGLSISIDAPSAAEHDGMRGLDGAFDAARTAARVSREAGLLVFLCTIATRESLSGGGLAAVADLAREMGLTLTVNYPVCSGRWSGVFGNPDRDPAAASAVAEPDAVVLPPDAWEALDKVLARPGVRWEGSSSFFREGCPAGGEKIYLTPYGDAMPCAGIHALYGNVREEPLEAIYGRMRATPFFRMSHPRCLAGASGRFAARVLGEVNRRVAEGPDGMRGSAEWLRTIDPVSLERHP